MSQTHWEQLLWVMMSSTICRQQHRSHQDATPAVWISEAEQLKWKYNTNHEEQRRTIFSLWLFSRSIKFSVLADINKSYSIMLQESVTHWIKRWCIISVCSVQCAMAALGLLEDVARWRQQWIHRDVADFLVHDDDWQLCVNQVKWACVHTRANRGSRH